MAMGQGPLDLEALARAHQRLAGQHRPQRIDRGWRQRGKVGERLVAQGTLVDLAPGGNPVHGLLPAEIDAVLAIAEHSSALPTAPAS